MELYTKEDVDSTTPEAARIAAPETRRARAA